MGRWRRTGRRCEVKQSFYFAAAQVRRDDCSPAAVKQPSVRGWDLGNFKITGQHSQSTVIVQLLFSPVRNSLNKNWHFSSEMFSSLLAHVGTVWLAWQTEGWELSILSSLETGEGVRCQGIICNSRLEVVTPSLVSTMSIGWPDQHFWRGDGNPKLSKQLLY